jgi:sterol desaturase/sphingolipid hydroxylase (fatty acid hydroxylase superfamily)
MTWPGLMAICLSISAYGFHVGHPVIYFNIAYAFILCALVSLERWMPHERAWLENDGQTLPNIYHTLTSKGTSQAIFIFSAAIGLAELIKPVAETSHGIWPREWPMWAQACLGVAVAEFGLYWAHRLAHEWPILWRFHAVHHSVKRLWVINTGRFHFLDSVFKIVLGTAVLMAFGAPLEVVQWTGIVTAYIGVLTHCNVEMRCGWLNYIFSTPNVHRWHHSLDLTEGDANYGENLVIWDIAFGTFVNKKHRPPVNIGIHSYMPPKFRHQLIWPFLSLKQKERIQNTYKDPEQAEKPTEESIEIGLAEAA